MEEYGRKVMPSQTKKHELEILGDIMGEEIDALPEWQEGKLVLWYGREWVQYDEFSDVEVLYSRYPAGAYMQTIALNPSVITEPKYIADAAMRINQQFDDVEFASGFIRGLQCPDAIIEFEDEARAILFMAGDYGRAGHWPSSFNWETGSVEWQLQPEQLGAAIATFIEPERVEPIIRKMLG